jgi:hypothetical protein
MIALLIRGNQPKISTLNSSRLMSKAKEARKRSIK